MNRGEVWWVQLDPPAGTRPVVILTRSAVVGTRNQLVVAQVTRTFRSLASEVRLTQAEGMPQNCVVNCDVLLTVEKALFLRRITTLTPARLAEVETALTFALELS
ncbi:MAG: type II toxin-antitoxin system PemK/MazF family toxin [Planctomycetaceae bacterium]